MSNRSSSLVAPSMGATTRLSKTLHAPRPAWSSDAEARLAKVPGFVRGMVKKIYSDYARERAIEEVTPELMDRARAELGLEGM